MIANVRMHAAPAGNLRDAGSIAELNGNDEAGVIAPAPPWHYPRRLAAVGASAYGVALGPRLPQRASYTIGWLSPSAGNCRSRAAVDSGHFPASDNGLGTERNLLPLARLRRIALKEPKRPPTDVLENGRWQML